MTTQNRQKLNAIKKREKKRWIIYENLFSI